MISYKVIDSKTLDKYKKEVFVETQSILSKKDIELIHFKGIVGLRDLNDFFGKSIFSILSYRPSKLNSNNKYITSWKYYYNCD